MTRSEIMDHLISEAARYDWNDIELYICEIGWESEWMCDYMDDPDAEMLSAWDTRHINEVLIKAFEEAHARRFTPLQRQKLLEY